MYEKIPGDWVRKELITPEDAAKIADFEARKPFSLHWELKSLLYLGVLLLNVGFGYIIYENIDHIGHAVIIAGIGAVSAGCFWYAFRHGRPFAPGPVETPTPYFDYILLLGCLTFLLMEGYWQYQYHVFGEQYGLATFLPMVLFFGLAYRFDHRGVLSLGITALASWMGITVAPTNLLADNDFNSQTIVLTGIFLGVLLTGLPYLSERLNLKKHFSITYLNFAVHVLMVSCLAGMFSTGYRLLYFLVLGLAVAYYIWYARKNQSFFFLLMAVIYGYIGLTNLIFSSVSSMDFPFYLFYFIATCLGIIYLLTHYKRFFKNDVR
jgi:hypothetical protein